MIHHLPLGFIKPIWKRIYWRYFVGPSVNADIKTFSERLDEALDLIRYYQGQVDFRLFGDAKKQRVMDLIQNTPIKPLYEQYDSKFRTALTIEQKRVLDELFDLRLNTSMDNTSIDNALKNALKIISDAKTLLDSMSL